MLQFYYGDGKGKTSCAVGCAVRAAGAGLKVLFVQFFKNGASSEIAVLEKTENIDCAFADVQYSLFNDENKDELCRSYNKLLLQILEKAKKYDMIILDEGSDALEYGYAERENFEKLLRLRGEKEIILTGHTAQKEIIENADYISEIKAIKHPYSLGVKARKGIEY